MPIEWMHAAAVQDMPTHHRDPFDRLIVAQAIAENLPLVSSDRLLKKYGPTLIW
jgi:PIN domain nuclease of toxin-antitoxin system